jgi:type I restriction enzyme S subunit
MDGEFRVSPWTNGSALLNQRVSRLIFYYENVGQRFIADSLQARLRELQGVKAYTTVDHLSGTQITEAVIGLPPLAEQHRIVAKVDELMALCDQLEQQQTHSIEAHQTLVEVLLGTLTRVESQQEFSAAWARITSHFDTLFTTEASIAQLKQTILQLAVMGKLVPQDPNDEPAVALYARIQRIKGELVKDGTIKRTSIEPNPTDDECNSLPTGWIWSRLGAVFDVRDGTHDTPKYTDEGFPLITSKNIYTGSLSFESAKFISEKDHRQISERSRVDRGDILFAMIGSIGNPVIVDTDREFSIKNVALFKYYAASDAEPRFLLLYLNLVAEVMREKSAGGVQSFVSLGFLRNYPFPLPPLNEQHRIVAKVDELMALCDTLKARLADAQAIQIHLADAIVEQALI